MCRFACLLVLLSIVDNDVVAVRLAGEVAVDNAWLQVELLTRLAQHTFQARLEILLDQACELITMGLATPMQTIERFEIHALRNIFNADTFQHTHTPERRHGNGERKLDTL